MTGNIIVRGSDMNTYVDFVITSTEIVNQRAWQWLSLQVSVSKKVCKKVDEMKFWTFDKRERAKEREFASLRGDTQMRIYRTFVLEGGFHAATASTERVERAGEGWKLRLISISARQNPPPIDGRGANPTGASADVSIFTKFNLNESYLYWWI